jgi:hypothetical protein
MSCRYHNREIYGIVHDSETGAPVVGARIRIGAMDGQCVPGTPDQRSGPHGAYSTTIADPDRGDGRYVFQVTAEGYQSVRGEVVAFPHPHGDKVHRPFALRKEESR